MNRRSFLYQSTCAAAMGYINHLPGASLYKDEILHLTILHTNDVHSRVDPFPMDGSRNEGQGGVARRKVIIDQVRKEGQPVLLLDAGDVFQGTPYFNLFGGEIEMKLMTELGYDAGTIGNHDFDGGIDGFEKQLKHADFPFIMSNYDFSDTILDGKTKPYKIWTYGNIKVGLYALGIELDGLVPKNLYTNTIYQDPIEKAREYERFLKDEMGCEYVICLSHLGFQYRGDKVSDVVIAQETSATDMIIGGHTHTFMREPHVEENKKGKAVLINQVGFGGIYLGRVDLFFEKGSKKRAQKGANIEVKK